jgi:hypothetical protein
MKLTLLAVARLPEPTTDRIFVFLETSQTLGICVYLGCLWTIFVESISVKCRTCVYDMTHTWLVNIDCTGCTAVA